MYRGVIIMAILLAFASSSIGASGWSDGGRWETSILGTKVKGHVEQSGNDIRGVVYIYPPFGKKNTYHFTGKVNGDKISGSHTDGHQFQGRLTSPQQVEGILTTKNGHRIPVTMSRR